MTKFVIFLGLQLICLLDLVHSRNVQLQNLPSQQDSNDLSGAILQRTKRWKVEAGGDLWDLVNRLHDVEKTVDSVKGLAQGDLNVTKAQLLLEQLLEKFPELVCTTVRNLPLVAVEEPTTPASTDRPTDLPISFELDIFNPFPFGTPKPLPNPINAGSLIHVNINNDMLKIRGSLGNILRIPAISKLDDYLVKKLPSLQFKYQLANYFRLLRVDVDEAEKLLIALFHKYPELVCPTVPSTPKP